MSYFISIYISKNFQTSSYHAKQKVIFNDNSYHLLNVYKVLRTLHINALTDHNTIMN